MQLERVMSMMRYWPANGTAGLARSRVSGKSRSPAPPASNTPRVSLIVLYLATGSLPQPYDDIRAASRRSSSHEDQCREDCTTNAPRAPNAAGLLTREA